MTVYVPSPAGVHHASTTTPTAASGERVVTIDSGPIPPAPQDLGG